MPPIEELAGKEGIPVPRLRPLGYAASVLLFVLTGCYWTDLTSRQMPASKAYFVFFAPGSASLDPPARTVVADAAAYAKVYPLAPITVTGHGDPSAGPKEAEEMAHRRAEALAKALAADGVDPRRITLTPPIITTDITSSQAARRGDIIVGNMP